MSITNVYIIPENEKYLPSKTEIEAIYNIMGSENFKNMNISYDMSNEIRFYDCGENFEKILCPICSSELDIDWWQEKMDKASENNFVGLEIITPCCHMNSSLNKLDYCYTQGFSKFAIRIGDYDFNHIDNIPVADLQSISREKWKIILARY